MPTSVEKPIKPEQILKELGDLWSNMAKPDVEAHDGGLLRACAMTLISFVDDEEDTLTISNIIGELMKEHPSRSVVVRLREGEGFLEHRVFAECRMPDGHRRQICCEQVEITASMNRLADVASIIGPLAVPDLPRIILLRSARLVRAGAIRKVIRLADKIVVDSARSGAPGFGELGGLLDANHITGDLAWTRITEIRALIAQLVGHCVPKNISIDYAGREAGPEARYLEAWLESSLPATHVGLRGSGGEGNGKPLAIAIDDLTVHLGDGSAEYELGGVRQHASMSKCTEEELLNSELAIVGHDPVFERALNRITA